MRIHTNLIESDIHAAMRAAGVTATGLTVHGSRKRDRAFNVILSGSSRRRQNGNRREPAATWDEWGVFLGTLFADDPDLVCWAYRGQSDFDRKTDGRFIDGDVPDDMHGDHTFRFDGLSLKCTHCSARLIR